MYTFFINLLVLEEMSTPEGFLEKLRPGVEISVDSIKINPKIIEVEEKLGNFVVEEKELILFIENNKNKLKKHCLKYDDGSMYLGYFNKLWQMEGYGVLILTDGSKYQGFFKNNKMNGRGRLINFNGDYYEGIAQYIKYR
jgi:hypothetical protein